MFSTIGYWICIPFAALLRLFYNMTGSFGVSVILFTLVIKLILLPFQMKSKKSMVRMNRMSGQINEIQKKYANNQVKMQEELQKFYAEEGYNPMSGCLWSFLPLPILIALYSIIRQPITHFMMVSEDVMQKLLTTLSNAGMNLAGIVQMKDGVAVMKDGLFQMDTYGQINLVEMITSKMPEAAADIEGWISVNYSFIGLDMSANPWDMLKNFSFNWATIGLILIPILCGALGWLQSKISMSGQKQDGPSAATNKSMMLMMPLMSIYFAFIMPAALGVYWVAQSVFSIIQEAILGKFYNKKLEEEENAREAARTADRKRRMEEAKEKEKQRQQQEEKKATLREKQKAAQEAKAKKAQKAAVSTTEAGRVGERPYARGRSYKADRYDDKE